MAKASFLTQFVALMKRNFILKMRNKKQTIQEVLSPVYFVVILAVMRLAIPITVYPPIEEFPENNITTREFLPKRQEDILVSPNTTVVRDIMTNSLQLLIVMSEDFYVPPRCRYFESKENAEEAYIAEDGIGLGVYFSNDLATFTIRAPFGTVPSVNSKWSSAGQCRVKSGLGGCPANLYLYSGFFNLQRAIESTIVNRTGFVMPVPDIKIQMYPKDEWTADVSYIQYVAAIYLVIAYAPFVNFLVVSLVTEKEQKIREAMRMMGLRDAAFWCSWAVTYSLIIFVVSVICLFLIWLCRFLRHSQVVIFLFILMEYGLTIITMAFMITPFFNKADKAGGLASLATMLFSLLYLPISLTRVPGVDGPESTIPVGGQFALSLLSPVAFALAVDQALYLDLYAGGMTWSNLNVGQFPLSYSMSMMAVDFFLYLLLALYFDKVIPNEYGQRQKPYFFLQPSFWRPNKKRGPEFLLDNVNTAAMSENHVTESYDDRIEPVSCGLRGKDAVRMYDVKKEFPSKDKKKPIMAVNGMTLSLYEGQITCLLGHNGAGKSTLINILTGLMPASSGSATIYGFDVSDNGDMEEVRCMTGVCPQHNVLFDDMTCEEHLNFFGRIKGVELHVLDSSVRSILQDVDLAEQREVRAEKLSGGQKRKLSVAIALIGDPRVILLDEPTAGMDPYSRRHLWAVLKSRRPGRVILLTTHFMDEADILADRKAFISKGKLQCVGSSLFLKNRFGIGYHLSLVVDAVNDDIVESVTSLVRSHVTEARLLRRHGMELNYALPHDSVSQFAGLFKALESLCSRGSSAHIQNYGVSMTTLEEVFLKLGVEEECEDDDEEDRHSDVSSEPLIGPQPSRVSLSPEDQSRTAEVQNGNSSASSVTSARVDFDSDTGSIEISLPEVNVSDLEDEKLTQRKFWALVKLRCLLLLRNKGMVVVRIILPVVFILVSAIVQTVISPIDSGSSEPLEMKSDLYTKVNDTSRGMPNMTYELGSNPGNRATDFLSALRQSGHCLTEIDDSTNLLDIAPHNLGVTLKQVTDSIAQFTAVYNDSATHSLPILSALITNTLHDALSGTPQEDITVRSDPWPNKSAVMNGWNNNVFLSSLFLGMALVFVPPSFCTAVVKDKQLKVRSQLRISGASMNLYWGSTMLVDGIQYAITCLISLVVLLAFQTPALLYGGAVLCLLLLYLMFIPVMMMCAYLLSFAFNKEATAMTVVPNLFTLASLLPYMVVAILDMVGYADVARALHIVFVLIDPPYAVYGGLYYINRVYLIQAALQGTQDPTIPVSEYFQWGNNIVVTFIVPFVQAVGFFFLLRLLEIRSTGGDTRDVCYCSSKDGGRERQVPVDNPDVPENEDEDVKAEREKVQNMTSEERQESIAIVENLRKEFTKTEGCCKSKKEDNLKTAVRNNTFAVSRGEVLGLLGPNGAGKTTTLNMIVAETGPTRGQVCICGSSIRSSLSDAFQAMGFCPQHDAFWNDITLREHLHLYSVLRGIPQCNIPRVIEYFLQSLQIEEHADKKSKALSGGTKRKLSYAMSMLGDPQIVLMDEPSTGMDPKSKRFLWDTISSAFSGSARGAILTTHYMEEADALCTRVGIMINGQLECLGSTQHLKNKYGSGYQLEMKLSPSQNQSAATADDIEHAHADHEELNAFVKELFSSAEQTEVFVDRLTYCIPQSEVGSLARVFSALEQGKLRYGIEEYSFSQSTLEQVFLEFAKHQIEEGQTVTTADELVISNENVPSVVTSPAPQGLQKRKSVLRQMSSKDQDTNETLSRSQDLDAVNESGGGDSGPHENDTIQINGASYVTEL